MIVGIVLSSIAILLVAARIYSRLFITRAPGIDDVLILISLVRAEPTFKRNAVLTRQQGFSIAFTVMGIIGNKKYVI